MPKRRRKDHGGYRQRGPDQLRTREPDRVRVLPLLDELGGLRPGAARAIHARTGVPEAEAFGTASFYHLVAKPDVEARICTGLTCDLAGAGEVLDRLRARGVRAEGCACLGQCDRAPAVFLTGDQHRGHGHYEVVPRVSLGAIDELVGIGGDVLAGLDRAPPASVVSASSEHLAIDLAADDDLDWIAWCKAQSIDPPTVRAEVKASGLRGRGGAGFPAGMKWEAVAVQPSGPRYVICNADEGEPGTFKDREVMERRPHLMLEGMVIAAHAVGAAHLVIYLRGEFDGPRRALELAIGEARRRGHLDGLELELALGHGAYICGEETALLEALEGRRGMPRHKPPYPTEAGVHGRPTLMNNVETFACVPAIITRGGAWFAGLGRGDAAGTKLYSISGHVKAPGVYELPMGASMAELLEAAGGMAGAPLKAFSPGGASSGFLPASEVDVPLDFGPLQARGSMLGSAGIVVLDETTDMVRAALAQARFFCAESCGQCAPCRIGTQVMVRLLERIASGRASKADLDTVDRVAWEMDAGSICGLGMAAPLPVVHLLRHFGDELRMAREQE